ncbi:retrovirus-related pol polyprotein from transposon TNT 1-94 [Tanacetum coccineum]
MKDEEGSREGEELELRTEDLDTYDSDCDDISNAQAVLMANISNYGSNVISEAQQDSMILSVIEQMSEQMINHINNWEKANKEQNKESVTAELDRYKERVKTFEQCLNIDLNSREKMIDSQMDDMIREKLALKEQVDSLKQNLSKQIKEKECLLQTFMVFKNESKEKEDKYIENETGLEKKIKELDNILFKVGQSAQTVHMLTKPQAFYDDIHKQALGYQNPFHLKKAQQIKPTLYDGIVMSDKHVAMPVIDDEETLILEDIFYVCLYLLIRLVQRGLHAQVRTVRTDRGTELLNKTLHAYFAQEGIEHQMSVARTPEQNGIVERRNPTLVEAARTMLSAAKVPLYFWAEAIATTCFTQNRPLVIPRHEKTPYHIINGQKPSVMFFHIFGSLCSIVKDGENLDKMKEKCAACIFVGNSTTSRAYQMASDHISSDPVPQCPTMALEQDSLSPIPQSQENVTQAAEIVATLNELDLLFSPMFDELLNGTTLFASNQAPTQVPTVTANENIIQAKTNKEYAQVGEDEFINVFSTPVQEQGETSSHYVDSSNMHTFNQRYPFEHRWIKDPPLEQIIGNPSQSNRTRCQLETDGEICMFALTVSRTKQKNIKEAIADSAWIEAMQEELHQFDRLDVWELVDKPLYKNVINIKWIWKNKRDEENNIIPTKLFL